MVLRAQAGHRTTRNALFERVTPRLTRMAAARLGRRSVASLEVEDIVQETLLRAFTSLEKFTPRCEGAFIFFLRRILLNVIADQGRKAKRAPPQAELEVEPAARGPSPVEAAVGTEAFENYQRAVERLPDGQREAVVLFVECGMDFPEIAAALESPSVDAARMVVARGVKKLAEWMHVRS